MKAGIGRAQHRLYAGLKKWQLCLKSPGFYQFAKVSEILLFVLSSKVDYHRNTLVDLSKICKIRVDFVHRECRDKSLKLT